MDGEYVGMRKQKYNLKNMGREKETQNRQSRKLNTNLISIYGRKVIEKLFFDFILQNSPWLEGERNQPQG